MKLTKSKYCKTIQCPKMLWMDNNMLEEFDDGVVNEHVLTVGNVVGDLAMEFFGEFTEVEWTKDKETMLSKTRELMDADTQIITEAAFSTKDCYGLVDILRKTKNGYEIIEVKGSTAYPDDTVDSVREFYLHDMAFQYYVIKNCNMNVEKISIMQLNKEYVRYGDLDIQKLFVIIDCTDKILEMQSDIENSIEQIRQVSTQENEPDEPIGGRCYNPYECGYTGWCWRDLPENNVFDIGWRMRGAIKEEAFHDGIITFKDIIDNYIPLNEKQYRQVQSTIHDLPPHIDKAQIKTFLDTIKYPLYHLDFETFQQAVPQWDGVSPYMQIPFQYSLHIQSEPLSEAIHKEFLGKEGLDPRRQLAEQLCADIPTDACVMAYYMSFEKTVISNLARLFPDLSEHLMSIHSNMIDLAKPFQSGAYYNREMGGSFSIKSVLPALFPNDSELDYNSLNIVKNGSDAMGIYATLHEKNPEEVSDIRTALLAYCKLDTLAMVRILEKLYHIVKK